MAAPSGSAHHVPNQGEEVEMPRSAPVAPGWYLGPEPKRTAAEQRILAEEHAILEARHA